jgi:hypothetical protein
MVSGRAVGSTPGGGFELGSVGLGISASGGWVSSSGWSLRAGFSFSFSLEARVSTSSRSMGWARGERLMHGTSFRTSLDRKEGCLGRGVDTLGLPLVAWVDEDEGGPSEVEDLLALRREDRVCVRVPVEEREPFSTSSLFFSSAWCSSGLVNLSEEGGGELGTGPGSFLALFDDGSSSAR